MRKILTYNPIRSAGCVTGENYKICFSTLHNLFGYFHISCYLDELPLSVNTSFTKADIETKMDLVMANEHDM